MNKKVFTFMLVCLLFFVIPKHGFAATEDTDINIEINEITLINLNPIYIENGNSLVYYRFFFESLGMTVDLDHATGRIYVFSEGQDSEPLLTLWLGSKKVLHKSREMTLSVPVRRIGNLTHIPVRSISEILGYQVQFNADEKVIRLTKTIPEEGEQIRRLLDGFFKEGQINPTREIFTEPGWNGYTNFDSDMGVPFNFLPLDTSNVSIEKIVFLSEYSAFVRVEYKSLSVAFKREIDFTFSAKKEKQGWKLAEFHIEGPRYELAEDAREKGAVITQQANDISAVMAGLNDYYQAWADGNVAAIIRSTSPIYISEFEMATGQRYADELTLIAYESDKQKVSETFIPYLSDDHAVIYVSELHMEWDYDNEKLVEVPVDVMIRMDKTLDGRWTVHSKLELIDYMLMISL